MPAQTFTIRTDATSYDVQATDAYDAVAQAVKAQDWAAIDSARETRDIADGAWLTVFDANGVPVLRRGVMP